MLWIQPLLSSSLSSSPSYERESTPISTPSSSSSSGSKISPAVLFIIVILAVLFFISGVLHLLVRFLLRQRSPNSHSNPYPEMPNSDAAQRQLQQLFHLHDSGLDQAFIDALPLFLYKEIMGLKEPFDCPVCLCEFSEQDKLRLLPLCSHAFHIDCIDTWLLSNSTCPLCRGTLFTPGVSIENPVFDFDDSRREEDGFFSGNLDHMMNIVSEKKMFSVRLGKYRSINVDVEGGEREVGETSNSNLDARRCYSMGSFQYVVANNADLQVEFCPNRCREGSNGGSDVRVVKGGLGHSGDSSICGDVEGKKINIGSKGESFSVSKIWLWSKRGKFPCPSDTNMVSSSDNLRLPWTDDRAAQAT